MQFMQAAPQCEATISEMHVHNYIIQKQKLSHMTMNFSNYLC